MQINRNIILSKNYISIGLLFLMIVLVFHIELHAQEVDSKDKNYNIHTTLTSVGEKLDSKSEILFSNSVAEIQKGEYEKAILYLDQLIKLNPELEQAYCSRGSCL